MDGWWLGLGVLSKVGGIRVRVGGFQADQGMEMMMRTQLLFHDFDDIFLPSLIIKAANFCQFRQI